MLVRSSYLTSGEEVPGLTAPCKVQVLGVLVPQPGDHRSAGTACSVTVGCRVSSQV